MYVVSVERTAGGDTPRRAVANYGLRPTVERTAVPLLEVHLLEDCPYTDGDALRVEWLAFLRPERKFAGIEELRGQIAHDCEAARAWFGL